MRSNNQKRKHAKTFINEVTLAQLCCHQQLSYVGRFDTFYEGVLDDRNINDTQVWIFEKRL